MENSEIIVLETKALVEKILKEEGSGHDWEHIRRVWHTALEIARTEPQAKKFIISMAALLHDLIDDKITTDVEKELGKLNHYLDEKGINSADKNHILEIIQTISFRKNTSVESLEGQVVQDADRLDAIGAIGIARAFTYGGSVGQPIVTFEGDADTISHFYEKLLKLKNLMNTQKGKEIAESRHQFMVLYLEQLEKEVT